MRKYIAMAALIAAAAYGQNQTCIVPSPSQPPKARAAIINLPTDGGTIGCTIEAIVPNGGPRTAQPIGNAKCATAVQMANQAAAVDNGWNDGGSP